MKETIPGGYIALLKSQTSHAQKYAKFYILKYGHFKKVL